MPRGANAGIPTTGPLLALLAVIAFCSSALAAADKEKESVYERIVRSGTIRCGYYVAYPYIAKDPNTGKMSGIWYDYMNELGRQLGFKVEWTEEVGFGDYAAALDAGRIDAYCIGVWVDPARAKVADYLTPITWHAAFAWGRPDDTRFDENYTALNSPAVTIIYADGDTAAVTAAQDFPRAKVVSVPQLTDPAQIFDSIIAGKADFTIYTPEVVAAYNRTHDKKLRQIPLGRPVRIYPESVAIKRGEHDLRRMLDLATGFMIRNGMIESILEKYESVPGSFYRTADPYKTPEGLDPDDD